MIEKIKGKNVNLLINGNPVAGSTSCTFALSANTADAASKSDPGDGMWDSPSVQNYSWTMSNESFVVGAGDLAVLLDTVINGDAVVDVHFQEANAVIGMAGKAVVTQLQVSASNGENVTLSLSLEGCTPLEIDTGAIDITPAKHSYIRGKALMVAVSEGEAWHTLGASTSHSLTVSVQTADITTKDDNDKGINKEATGKSISLSTENLLAVAAGGSDSVLFVNLLSKAVEGKALKLMFGYYPNSIGNSVGESDDWGAASDVIVSGDFICTNLSINAPNKENATYSAEFSGQGMPTVGSSVATVSEGGEA